MFKILTCTYKILLVIKIITCTYKILLMIKIITYTYKKYTENTKPKIVRNRQNRLMIQSKLCKLW